jgi:acetaldehyde dehydrogenase (acetylating)
MIRTGIIGTGNIGTDLLVKLVKSKKYQIEIFCGRRMESPGIQKALELGISVSDKSIQYFVENPKCCDVVFDCTSAVDALENYKVFHDQDITVIDMTPSKIGKLCVPIINGEIIKTEKNVNMITCGGQSTIPILNFLSHHCDSLDYVELVSQVSSNSAGMATRINIDHYIQTTQDAIQKFSGAKRCKVILNLNPADPCVNMQNTLFIRATNLDPRSTQEGFNDLIRKVREYVPKYEMTMFPVINEDGILIMSLSVEGSGDYLPSYAGNLDIINCAAIKTLDFLND